MASRKNMCSFSLLSSHIFEFKNSTPRTPQKKRRARVPMSSKESGAARSAEGYYYCKVCQQTFFGTYAVDSRCINTRKCAGEVRKCAGVLECLKYIHVLLDGYSFLGQACIDAARYGHLSCLQYVVENAKMTLKEGAEILSEACAEAKRLKRYTCLEYLRSLLQHD